MSTTQKDLRATITPIIARWVLPDGPKSQSEIIEALVSAIAALPSAEEGKAKEEAVDKYMEAILCIAQWDLHHHSLLSAVRSLLVTRRKLTDAQSAVLTNMLDELAEKAQRTPPAWPKKDASPSPSERCPSPAAMEAALEIIDKRDTFCIGKSKAYFGAEEAAAIIDRKFPREEDGAEAEIIGSVATQICTMKDGALWNEMMEVRMTLSQMLFRVRRAALQDSRK